LGVVVFLFFAFHFILSLTVELKSKTTTSIGGKTYFTEYSQNGIKKNKAKIN